jgi:hypothetical protein
MESREMKLSPRAKMVWKEIGEKQRTIIQKNWPLRRDRNEAICQLAAKGVTIPILVELTGLSRNQIIRIKRAKARPPKGMPDIITLSPKQPVVIFKHSFIVVLEDFENEQGGLDHKEAA